MKTRAAVAWEAGKPLSVEEVDLAGPKKGEVLIRNVATGVCHTDAYTLSGADPEGAFPSILGHEGGAIVEEVGAEREEREARRPRDPALHAGVRECKFCKSGRTNSVPAIRVDPGQGPDARRHVAASPRTASRSCTTWARARSPNTPCCPRSRSRRSAKKAPLDKVCLLGCGITTGIGAVLNTAKVRPGSTVAVFGLGGIGLA